MSDASQMLPSFPRHLNGNSQETAALLFSTPLVKAIAWLKKKKKNQTEDTLAPAWSGLRFALQPLMLRLTFIPFISVVTVACTSLILKGGIYCCAAVLICPTHTRGQALCKWGGSPPQVTFVKNCQAQINFCESMY